MLKNSSSVAMLATKTLASVAPVVNLRKLVIYMPLLSANKTGQSDWNSEETSPQVQNRGISGHKCPPKLKQKLYYVQAADIFKINMTSVWIDFIVHYMEFIEIFNTEYRKVRKSMCVKDDTTFTREKTLAASLSISPN